MEPITVKLYVNPTTAIRAGKSRSGELSLQLTDEQVSSLTDAERAELAEAVHNKWLLGNRGTDPHVLDGTWEEARAVLSARAERTAREQAEEAARTAQRKAEEQAKQEATDRAAAEAWPQVKVALLADPDHRHSSAWYGESKRRCIERLGYKDSVASALERLAYADEELRADFQAKTAAAKAAEEQRKREAEEAKERREANLRQAYAAAINDWGDESQRKRMVAGYLPEDEGWALIRDHVFAAVRAVRYQKMTAGDIEHGDDCDSPSPTYERDIAVALTGRQYDELERLKALAPEGATVTPRRHTAQCERCDGPKAHRYSALIAIDWHGRELSRAYALPDA